MPRSTISKPTILRGGPSAFCSRSDRGAEEVVFLPADDPVQVGFDGRGRFVDVVAVQAHAGLEPERVARAEAARE